MKNIFIKELDCYIEVDDNGSFYLPSEIKYTAALLNKIARVINREIRKASWDNSF